MADLDAFAAQVHEKASGILSGHWGDSEQIRRRSTGWYQQLGVSSAQAASGTLHPIAEYAANCAFLKEPSSVDVIDVLTRCPTVNMSAAMPQRWLFTSSNDDDALLSLVTSRTENQWTIRPTSTELQNRLSAAVQLTFAISPDIGADALSYTRRHMFVASDQLIGRTWVDIGGFTITGDPALESDAHLAESIFHEALHSKFYTLERGMEEPTPDEAGSPKPVTIPWQRDPDGSDQLWTAQRSVDAFYVYVHLTIFRLQLLLQTGGVANLERLRRVCLRAGYLSRQISSVCPPYLDPERAEIASWLDLWRIPEFDLSHEGEDWLARAEVRQ